MPNLGRWGSLGSGVAPIESPTTTFQYLSIQSFHLFGTVWPQFQCQFIALNSIDPRLWLGWTEVDEMAKFTKPTFLARVRLAYQGSYQG